MYKIRGRGQEELHHAPKPEARGSSREEQPTPEDRGSKDRSYPACTLCRGASEGPEPGLGGPSLASCAVGGVRIRSPAIGP